MCNYLFLNNIYSIIFKHNHPVNEFKVPSQLNTHNRDISRSSMKSSLAHDKSSQSQGESWKVKGHDLIGGHMSHVHIVSRLL